MKIAPGLRGFVQDQPTNWFPQRELGRKLIDRFVDEVRDSTERSV